MRLRRSLKRNDRVITRRNGTVIRNSSLLTPDSSLILSYQHFLFDASDFYLAFTFGIRYNKAVRKTIITEG